MNTLEGLGFSETIKAALMQIGLLLREGLLDEVALEHAVMSLFRQKLCARSVACGVACREQHTDGHGALGVA